MDVPEGILELRRRDVAASLAGDAAALRALWTEDPVVLAPGVRPVRGSGLEGAFRSMAEELARVEVLGYEQTFEETLVLGDLAVEWGTVRGRERDRRTGAVRSEAYKLMRILRRMPDGSWRVHRSIWNDAPAEEEP